MNTLLLAIIGHLVGDYLLQNDWMALNKKARSWPCAIHCALWATAVCVFADWRAAWVWPVLFIAHFVQDRTTIIHFWMTRVNRQAKFTEPPMAPWSLIVVDNVWHIVSLYIVARFIG